MDEIILELDEKLTEEYRQLVDDAMKELNAQLKLNRDLGCDIQFGKTYAEIH